MTCPTCNTKIEKDFSFCDQCGSSLNIVNEVGGMDFFERTHFKLCRDFLATIFTRENINYRVDRYLTRGRRYDFPYSYRFFVAKGDVERAVQLKKKYWNEYAALEKSEFRARWQKFFFILLGFVAVAVLLTMLSEHHH
jgi:hypothetical protein